jgi:replication factor C subunit 2/4
LLFRGFPCPPFKLIILDEADSLTADAQTALRRTIEQHSRSTRFCLICNYVSRIIDPLTSRCAKFRFGPIAVNDAVLRLREICLKESVAFVSEEGEQASLLAELINVCDGDLRRAITMLQGAHRLCQPLSSAVIAQMAGTLPGPLLAKLHALLVEPAPLGIAAKNIVRFVREDIERAAFAPSILLHQYVLGSLLNDSAIPSLSRALIVSKAADVEARIQEGADEIVQISDFLMNARALLHPTESATLRERSLIVL